MCQQSVIEVVEDWLQQSSREGRPATIYDVVCDDPEVGWQAILQILERELTVDQIGVLAAGPLEDLLALHGPEFIDRVEREAPLNPRFHHLLGSVWKNRILPEIWERIQKARGELW